MTHWHWYTWLFALLAFLAFTGVYRYSRQGIGTKMLYSLLMTAVWVGLAVWSI